MWRDEVTVATTTHLMISIIVRTATAFQAGVVVTVKWDLGPILQTATKLPVLEMIMKTQGRRRDPFSQSPA